LLLSTDEKLGLEDELLVLEPLVLEPEAALPDEDLSDEPDELLPDAAGEDDEEPLPEADGEDDEELCATATLDSANSAAAVAALRTFSFSIRYLLERGKDLPPARCKPRAPSAGVGVEFFLRCSASSFPPSLSSSSAISSGAGPMTTTSPGG